MPKAEIKMRLTEIDRIVFRETGTKVKVASMGKGKVVQKKGVNDTR